MFEKKKIYVIPILILLLFVLLILALLFLRNRSPSRQGFTTGSTSHPIASTSHTVNLPLNTTYSCENMCGPQNRCSISGEQCTSDVDCYGCQPPPKKEIALTPDVGGQNKAVSTYDVGGQNDAGKLTGGVTPTYSTLTTDIGSRAALIHGHDTNIEPVQYFNGVDQWRNAFDRGMEMYDKRYNSQVESLSYLPHYPNRPTLSGQFIDNGPLASNAYL